MRNRYVKFNLTPLALRVSSFFDGLDDAARRDVLRYCEGRRYHKGARIIAYGDATRDVFFVCAGRVSAVMLSGDHPDESGKVLTCQELKAGEMFGELSAIDGEPRSTSVVAVEESAILRIAGNGFQELLSRYPVLAHRTLLRVCQLSRYLCDRSIVSRVYSIPRQISLEILRVITVASHSGTRYSIDPAPTHQEIARRVGTNREQVTRVISKLVRARLLERGPRRWTVPDGPALIEHLATS